MTEILHRRKSNTYEDISEIEERIDRLVYEIYELTGEEINIIETAED